MVSTAVKELQSAKKQIAAQISGLEKEAKQIDQAISALTGLSVGGAVAAKPSKKRKMSAAGRKAIAAAARARWAKHNAAKAGKAVVAKPAKKRKTMSPLGKLKIKLGSLNRYGKTEEAKVVQAKIAALEAKMAKK